MRNTLNATTSLKPHRHYKNWADWGMINKSKDLQSFRNQRQALFNQSSTFTSSRSAGQLHKENSHRISELEILWEKNCLAKIGTCISTPLLRSQVSTMYIFNIWPSIMEMVVYMQGFPPLL